MSKGLDPRWDGSTISRSNRRMSRLTNGAPARVFHQGPQQLNAARMTVCSFAVRTLAQTTLQLDSGRSPCSDVDDMQSTLPTQADTGNAASTERPERPDARRTDESA